MKRIAFFAIVLAPHFAEAQGSGESSFHFQNKFEIDSLRQSDLSSPRIFSEAYRYLGASQRCGIWGFGYFETSGYLSLVQGPFCDLSERLSLGIAFGGELYYEEEGFKLFPRYALSVFFGGEESFLDAYLETGPSGLWYRGEFQVWGDEYVALGFLTQGGDGYGPKMTFSLPIGELNIRFYGAPMFKGRELQGLLFGVDLVGRPEVESEDR